MGDSAVFHTLNTSKGIGEDGSVYLGGYRGLCMSAKPSWHVGMLAACLEPQQPCLEMLPHAPPPFTTSG